MPKFGRSGNNVAVVVAAVAMPPPVNGQTLINASVLRGLQNSAAVTLRLVDTSPRTQRRTLSYHLRRLARVCLVPLVLGSNIRHKRRSFYTVVEPGLGMYYNLFTIIFARIFCYRIFLHHHASSYAKYYDRRFAALCSAAGRKTVHVALSEHMAMDLTARYPLAQTVVAHNASHIQSPGVQRAEHGTTGITIGFLSNLSLDKGLDTVLTTFEAIRSEGTHARLLLAGPILDNGARDLIENVRPKFGDALIELGALSGEAKDAFFKEIDLFLFPSRYRFEAQPLVVLEALSYGITVLATDHGYTKEIIAPLGTGFHASDFIHFTVKFVQEWTRSETFRRLQREAARSRFLELTSNAEYQQNTLYRLIAWSEVDNLTAI